MIGGRSRIFSLVEFSPKGYLVCTSKRYFASQEDVEPQVRIPKRIERGPTDLLKALAETVQTDPKGIPYRLPDDPIFYPRSSKFKRNLTLTIESGRRAARYVFENHPDIFQKQIADPMIESYIPKEHYDENSDVTEEDLKNVIFETDVEKAIKVYKLLQEKSIEVSSDVEQQLLELVCFYNCENKPSINELDIKWWELNRKNENVNTWKSNGFAEELFKKLPPSDLTYSALIQGRLKYENLQSALDLFDEVRQNHTLSVGVYNEVFSRITRFISSNPDRWSYIIHLLEEMNEKKIKPNLYTLNSIMKTLFLMKNWKETEENTLKLLSEFDNIGVYPSLATYWCLFSIMSTFKRKNKPGPTTSDLIRKLSSQNLEIRHPDDIFFFGHTMFTSYKIKSVSTAKMIHSLLKKSGNSKFIASAFEENMYYKFYFLVLLQNEQLEEAVQLYDELVPNVYTPKCEIFEEFIRAIKRHEAYEHLPKFWEDIKKNSHITYNMIKGILSMAPGYKSDAKDEVSDIFFTAASLIFNKSNESLFIEDPLFFDGEVSELSAVEKLDILIPNIFLIFVRNKLKSEVLEIFDKIKKDRTVPEIHPQGIKEFYEFCMSEKNTPLILECLKYAETVNYPECRKLAQDILLKITDLSEDDKKWVKFIADKKEKSPPKFDKKEKGPPKFDKKEKGPLKFDKKEKSTPKLDTEKQ